MKDTQDYSNYCQSEIPNMNNWSLFKMPEHFRSDPMESNRMANYIYSPGIPIKILGVKCAIYKSFINFMVNVNNCVFTLYFGYLQYQMGWGKNINYIGNTTLLGHYT